MSAQMASAVEEQSGVADHISEQITQIADTARETQKTAEQTQHSSNELQNTSKELYSLIERFNLKVNGSAHLIQKYHLCERVV